MKQTSIDSYNSTRNSAATHRNMILEAMSSVDIPVTSEEISVLSGLRYDQTWRRMSELERDGKIVSTKEIGITTSGRPAYKWMLNTKN